MDTKERILTLLQYLKENTDEETPASNISILQMFREKGDSVSIPTLRNDIAALRKYGFDIDVNEVNGVGTYYKFLGRDWSLPEKRFSMRRYFPTNVVCRPRPSAFWVAMSHRAQSIPL